MVPGHQQPRPTPARALCEAERERVLDTLGCERFVDRSPAEVVATLAGRRAVPVLGTHDVSDPGCEPAGARTTKSAHPSELHQARYWWRPDRTRPGAGTSRACWGRNPGRTSTCTCCSTSSADTRSGGWSRSGKAPRLAARPHRANLPQPRHRTPDAHPLSANMPETLAPRGISVGRGGENSMRTETDPVTSGRRRAQRPWGRRSVATRPPGAKSAKTDWLRIRRSWPSQCGASSLPSHRLRFVERGGPAVHGRARSVRAPSP